MLRHTQQALAILLFVGCTGLPMNSATSGEIVRHDLPIHVVNPLTLPKGPLPAVRTSLGIANDYKPWIARLPGGDLLVVAFCFGAVEGVDGYMERAVFWRSHNGGRTWGPRVERQDVHGREFALNVLRDGTILMPCHLLARDVSNTSNYTHSKLFRSEDGGLRWTEIRIGPEGFPAGAN
ncbi:MAG: sialidase family protein, partial [Pirellulaceae bacterium]|nr:sialidase family protein [Pirellulaceae bacterium]